MSQRIVSAGGRRSHRLDRWKTADREHVIHEFKQQGLLSWTTGTDTRSTAGTLIPMMNYTMFPLSNMWLDSGMGISNARLVYSYPVGWNYSGADVWGQLFNHYKFSYVTSVSVSWSLARADGEDDGQTEFAVYPVNTEQFASMVKSPASSSSTPNKTVPPEYLAAPTQEDTDISIWNQVKKVPYVKWKRLSNRFGPGQRKTIKMHVPVRKYAYPGYPLASSSFWTGHDCKTQDITQPNSTLRTYIGLGIFNNHDSTTTSYDYQLSVKYYVTHFMPRFPLFDKCNGCIGYLMSATGPDGPDHLMTFNPCPTGGTGFFSTGDTGDQSVTGETPGYTLSSTLLAQPGSESLHLPILPGLQPSPLKRSGLDHHLLQTALDVPGPPSSPVLGPPIEKKCRCH